MKKFNKRERILSSAILVCLPLVYLAVVAPQQARQVSGLNISVQTATTQLQESQANLAGLMTQVATSKKSLDTNDEVKRYLEANRHMSNLLRKLGANEEEHGMILKNITVDQNKKMNNFYQTTMKVEVESSFVALGNFLGALSDTETLIDVKTVMLNRIDSDLKRCTAVIEVNGYFNEGPKL